MASRKASRWEISGRRLLRAPFSFVFIPPNKPSATPRNRQRSRARLASFLIWSLTLPPPLSLIIEMRRTPRLSQTQRPPKGSHLDSLPSGLQPQGLRPRRILPPIFAASGTRSRVFWKVPDQSTNPGIGHDRRPLLLGKLS